MRGSHGWVGTGRALHLQAVGTAGAREGDAGHHQDTARAARQVGSSPHTDPSSMALPAQPHTHKEPATPNPSSQACCSCVVSRKRVIEQQGVLGARLAAGQAGPQQGRWQRPVCYADGTEHTRPWPHALPWGWTGTDLAQQRAPSTLPSLSQPTQQAVDIKDMQHINKNSWNLKKKDYTTYM